MPSSKFDYLFFNSSYENKYDSIHPVPQRTWPFSIGSRAGTISHQNSFAQRLQANGTFLSSLCTKSLFDRGRPLYENGEFFVAHDRDEIIPSDTFDALYLKPLLHQIARNGGSVWKDGQHSIQLLMEIKSSDPDAYLKALEKKLMAYPDIFCPKGKEPLVRIVITGNIPSPDSFSRYADFIYFDGNIDEPYTDEQIKRIGLFSANFKSLSLWNGKGMMVKADREKVSEAIKYAHQQGKPIRFWGAPDGMTAWNTFQMMEVDYINTDKIEACTSFFKNWHNKHYQINSQASALSGVSMTDRLDKTTHAFEGFQNDKLQLTDRVETYTPTFLNDGKELPVKNVIFLIGDGMGLAQLTAADYINRGLTTLCMQHIGLIQTSAKDAFTTDSAGAGSALARRT